MEILFISHKYPPSTGGMEKQSYELINGMKAYTKVHTIVYDGKQSRFKFFLTLNRRISKYRNANPGISVIHYNDALLATFCLMRKQDKDLKQVVTVHGLDVVFPLSFYQKNILPRFNKYDLIIAVSQATADACIVRGINRQKLVVINNGVDINISPKSDRKKVDELLTFKYNINTKNKQILVALGRPVKRKGYSWFIRNVSPKLDKNFITLLIGPINTEKRRIMDLFPDQLTHHLELLLGLPSDERTMDKMLTSMWISDKVVRTGKLTFTEITEIMSVADAFVMPNIEVEGDMEGFGLVCLEAVLSGAKVFAAASGGIIDAIQSGKNGWLLTSGDHEEWIRKINSISSHDYESELPTYQRIKYTVENFSWKKMVKQYFECFEGL